MNLSAVGLRFQGFLTTSTGKRFRGLIIEASILRDRSAINDYILRTALSAVVHPGEIVLYDGAQYILATAATEMVGFPLFRFLRMILVTHILPWTRPITVTDTLTTLDRDSGSPQDLGMVAISLVPEGKIDDAFRIQGSKYRVVAGSALQLNDRVGPYVVTFVEPKYGVTFVEAK